MKGKKIHEVKGGSSEVERRREMGEIQEGLPVGCKIAGWGGVRRGEGSRVSLRVWLLYQISGGWDTGFKPSLEDPGGEPLGWTLGGFLEHCRGHEKDVGEAERAHHSQRKICISLLCL